jgi:hypothetical protein
MKKQLTGKLVAGIMIAGLAGCTSPALHAAGQNLLEEALVREAKLTKSYSVTTEDRIFSAKVSGSDKPAVASEDDFYHLVVPIGTDVPVECLIYKDALDSAATLKGLLNGMLDEFPKTGILKIDAGTFGRLPYLYQESLYLTEENAAGALKGIVIPNDTTTLACLHDEPGYRETFRQVVGSLADSMRMSNATPENWIFQEILVWQLQDLKVGFTMNSVAKGENGQIMSVIETAVIVPRTADETMSQDAYDVVYEKASGEMIGGSYAESTSGELTMSIELEQVPESGYRVSGQFQGKEVDSRLDTKTTPVGPYYQLIELVRAANPDDGKPRPLSMDTYVPSANPLQMVPVEAKPTGQRVDGLPEYTLLFSGMEAKSVIDDKGQQSVTLQMGPMEMQLKRVYFNGQI